MKLETERNTNLDIAGYLCDIGHFKLTAAVCICKHLPACIPNNGLFSRVCVCLSVASTARTLTETKRRQRKEVFVLLTILSNNPYLHLCRSVSSAAAGESRGYALIMASSPGHRQGRRTWGIIHCVTGAVGPQQTRSTVDEDTVPHNSPRATLALRLVPLPFFPSSALFSVRSSPMSRGVRKSLV